MDKRKLFDALNGLFAYDSGATDSGIQDSDLRKEVNAYLDSLDENNFRILLTEFIRVYFVSEEAVKEGYGIEDVSIFIRWLSNTLDIDV